MQTSRSEYILETIPELARFSQGRLKKRPKNIADPKNRPSKVEKRGARKAKEERRRESEK